MKAHDVAAKQRLKVHPSPLSRAVMVTACFLTALGLLAIYGASALKGAETFADPYYFLKKQTVAAALGLLLMGGMQFVPLRWLAHLTLPLLVASLVCLALIFVPGAYLRVGGAERWLKLGFARFQPSESAKLALIFFLARNLARPHCDLRALRRGLLPNLIVVGLFVVLLMKQPDFGTTALLCMVAFAMLYVAGATRGFLAGALAGLGLAGVAAVIAAPYRLRRILTFLDPWADLQNGGFQIIQSYLGFQNGGLWGSGLGESRQKLFFLPEAHTDFIFAVIGEELGFLGALLVCVLFLFLSGVGYRIAFLQHNRFYRLLAFGLTTLIACQAAFNLGVVMGLLPTKGIPLPFISSGVSSLLAFLLAAGIIARIGQEEENLRPHDDPSS